MLNNKPSLERLHKPKQIKNTQPGEREEEEEKEGKYGL